MSVDHKVLYDSEHISQDYKRRDYLEPAEETFLKDLGAPKLSLMDMLDMGVGGGRTTKYFAPLARSYIGADYAPAMLKACKERYGSDFNFIECDARKMQDLKDDSFDFVLFSFNGIDSFSHKDRMSALLEVRRVLRNNGLFFFSSHNLNWKGLKNLFSIKNHLKKVTEISSNIENKNPLKHITIKTKAAYRVFRLKILNKTVDMERHVDKLRKNQRGNIYDNSLNGKASIYYVTPQEQEKQLKKAGFAEISFYSRTGIKTSDEKILNEGGWVYYCCRADKS